MKIVVKREARLVTNQRTGELMIKITFPFNFQDLEDVKTLSGRKYHNDGENKFWTCPLVIESIEKLKYFDFSLEDKLEELLIKSKAGIDDTTEIEIPGLKMELFPFQRKGVAFIESRNGRALVGDEMGLGKTAQALAWLWLHREKRPAIIVVPASLKLNWKKEANMWLPDPKVQILTGKNSNCLIDGEIIVINYDVLPAWVKTLQGIKPKVLILDEIHYIKNSQAKRTKAVKELGKKIPHILGLSGTLIINRPVEFYNALRLIDRTIVPNRWDFCMRYCAPRNNGFGWDFSGSSNTDELHQRLLPIMIRRKKSDVLTELPEKTRSFVPIELDNYNEYQQADAHFLDWVKENRGQEAADKASNAEALAQIEVLKQVAVQGKLEKAIEWIQDFININGKLVVFATHRFVIERLMNIFGDIAVKLDGSSNQEERENAVNQFQTNDNVRLFIGNIKAAGVGITLTAASDVAFLELPWSPGDLSQAEDRCHRIGQRNAVTIYYLLASGTIEEKIAKLIDYKRKVLDKILDGEITESSSLLSEIMKQFIKKEN